MRNVKTIILWLAVIVAAGAVSFWQKSDDPPASPPRNDGPVVIATVAGEAPAPSEERVDQEWPRVHELVTDSVEREQLLRTLDLIERGGPFPYPKKDGSTFSNREKRLPSKPKGYYREYTVPTPGASNRGARRVVQGKSGETYYTDDHYDTFIRLDAE
ncbi:MAG TPA: ribonuclease domain-containing protein [Thermoanaerobaculia bacterium]|nr:ribonuclease domain-containing protein [Thermoanaerobaculia bacterium]